MLLQSEEEREKIAVTEGQLFLKEIFSRQTFLCLSHVKKRYKSRYIYTKVSHYFSSFTITFLEQMSLSKLESLPNEILSDIIEKYINGVDVLTNFSYQLNQRFNGLIEQCHRLRFNFIQCQKNEFRFCMGLLPAYIDKVEELAISEQDAPGQIHAFLSFFPSFTVFKRLRKLYIYCDCNGNSFDLDMVERALLSLSDTSIESLSIEMQSLPIEIENITHIRSLKRILFHLFHLKTLRRLCLVGGLDRIDWNDLLGISSNIEYIILPHIHCELRYLQSIIQWAPRLKYLHIGITDNRFSLGDKSKSKAKENTIPFSTLLTLVLSFENTNQITVDMLAPCLNAMPLLNCLEIDASSKLVDADAWMMLLKTSLPLLTHFTLRITLPQLSKISVHNVQASFQNLFWISKKNFNLIITTPRILDSESDERLFRQERSQHDYEQPVLQCWMAPDRTVKGDTITMDKIPSLILSSTSNIARCDYYVNNVKWLTVDNIDESLLRWVTTHVNCSRITELSIGMSCKHSKELASLLICTSNKNSLRITFDLLFAYKDILMGETNCLERLNISGFEHIFDEYHINIIARLFPHLEHLIIKTPDLDSVSLLMTCFPHLHSLTFYLALQYLQYLQRNLSRDRFDYYDLDERQRFVYDLTRRTNFLFRLREDWMTIWMDQAACEEPFWRNFALPSEELPAMSNPISISSNDKKKNKFFSFWKIFKK